MTRAIAENTDTARLGNHPFSKVSTIDYVPFGENAPVKVQTHPPTLSCSFTNQSTCPRCGGLMVSDSYLDVLDKGESNFPPKRCVQCGEVVDLVILLNRQLGQQPMTVQPATEMLSNACVTKGQ